MNIQHSFTDDKPTLYLVATPIGNLDEMTPRAVDILKTVDIIAAEDTRHSRKLCAHFQIKTPMITHHAHNSSESANGILELLKSGKNVALVSDAGYPCISDPGQELVALVSNEGYSVVPVSGSSAFVNALVCSGLAVQPFLFYGFLASKSSEIVRELKTVKDVPYTLVFYVSVHKIKRTLEVCYDVLGNRKTVIARELTKQFETFYRGDLASLIQTDELEEKGEFVLMIEGNNKTEDPVNDELILKTYQLYIDQGMQTKEAMKAVCEALSVSRNYVYSLIHSLRKLP